MMEDSLSHVGYIGSTYTCTDMPNGRHRVYERIDRMLVNRHGNALNPRQRPLTLLSSTCDVEDDFDFKTHPKRMRIFDIDIKLIVIHCFFIKNFIGNRNQEKMIKEGDKHNILSHFGQK
ncbi:hypothetical protein KSP39_PZI015673 [Platanthera zijinensis]|uniref:Uncharacterized protein n=1 Tax=Platanthera zijinensis TaxID=2320716 RepID=A0AAP0G1D9_9ASPA